MVANDGNVLVESFCQFAEPSLLLLSRVTIFEIDAEVRAMLSEIGNDA
jgi:hypothetical protein